MRKKLEREWQPAAWRNVNARFPGFTKEVADHYWHQIDDERVDIKSPKLASLLLVHLPNGIDVSDRETSALVEQPALSTDAEVIAIWAQDVYKHYELIEAFLDGQLLIPLKNGDTSSTYDSYAELKDDISSLKEENERLNILISEIQLSTSDLNAKRKNSLFKIIIGIAKEEHEYKKSGNNRAAKSISDTVARAGINIDEDTVRSVLSEASEHLDMF